MIVLNDRLCKTNTMNAKLSEAVHVAAAQPRKGAQPTAGALDVQGDRLYSRQLSQLEQIIVHLAVYWLPLHLASSPFGMIAKSEERELRFQHRRQRPIEAKEERKGPRPRPMTKERP